MQVYFASELLARRLGLARNRIAEFGPAAALRIDLRLQQLCSAPTLAHARALPGRCRKLCPDQRGGYAIDVMPPLGLVFVPTDVDPDSAEPIVDWASVESITITDVVGNRQG